MTDGAQDELVKARQTMSRWYIIHAYSGFENKVKDQILADAQRMGLAGLVESVEVPTEKVTDIRRGKTVTTAIMVLIMTLMLAIFFFGVDSMFNTIVQFLLGLLA
jgi:preprotein translocase SecE subunit